MAYMFIRITVPNTSVTQMNVQVGDSGNPHDGVQLIENLLCGLQAGSTDGQVDVYVSGTDETLTAQNGGASASYDLN
jgi:hypothetical protein